MASIRLQPPENFDFAKPDEWPRWKKRFLQFRSASGLKAEEESRQVDTLLYCLGEEVESVLASTNITEDDRKKFDTVLEKLDTYFNVRRNVILERAKFNRRCQQEGEAAEQFITELDRLIEFCEYGALKEEMIRDRLVVGIRDMALSEKLQTDSTLTLEKAKTAIRQKEAAKEHRKELRDDAAVGRLHQGKHTSKKSSGFGVYPRRPQGSKGGAYGQHKETKCTRCGRDKHQSGDRCPAMGVTCHNCNKKGHFSAHCFLPKSISAVTGEAPEEAFLGAMRTNQETSWSVDVQVDNKSVSFKMDTGAEVTAINNATYQHLGKPKLEKASKVLYGPAHNTLDVMGMFTARIARGKLSTQEKLYVVKGLDTNLLGLQAITALKLISRLNAAGASESSNEPEVVKQFSQVFQGLGTIGDEYRIKLKEGASPYSLFVPRNVPIPLRDKVKEELDRMEKMEVISKATAPTPWCAGMVVVPKKSGEVRICVDLKPLNDSVLREPHPISKVDDTLALLSGATHFSKLDANSGFWQIPLAEESRPLTTFITPFGRYHFNKLPFGISCAPELFQRRMNQILEGLEGVVCLIDDILIVGSSQEEHDARALPDCSRCFLQRLQEAGVTLNRQKCEFCKSSIKFIGHVVDRHGISADPEKTSAILSTDAPKSVSDLRRFMGLANQLGKFSSQLAEISQPLRELLHKGRIWVWGPTQEKSFSDMKKELVKPMVLALYDPRKKTKVSADASSYGLGAVLLQFDGHMWKPVAFASRSLSDTEKRYAQVEKEALASTWACEKFRNYLLGLPSFLIETDNKPLVPLLNTKHLDNLPPRILRFRLRLAKYDYVAEHIPGKCIYAADALSRAPSPEGTDEELQGEVEVYLQSITVPSIPATSERLQTYRQAQMEDELCSKVREYCKSQWPVRDSVQSSLKPYWKVRGSLTLCEDLLLYNSRIVVPPSLRRDTMMKIHEGHQGVERCRSRLRSSVWWPGVTSQVKDFVESCRECAMAARQKREPLIPTPLPEYPWQEVGTDLFELKGQHYTVKNRQLL